MDDSETDTDEESKMVICESMPPDETSSMLQITFQPPPGITLLFSSHSDDKELEAAADVAKEREERERRSRQMSETTDDAPDLTCPEHVSDSGMVIGSRLQT